MKPPAPYEDAVTFQFGDSPELADELLALVLAGAKTATCGALRDFNAELGGEGFAINDLCSHGR